MGKRKPQKSLPCLFLSPSRLETDFLHGKDPIHAASYTKHLCHHYKMQSCLMLLIVHLMSSPNSFKCSSFTSLRAIKYSPSPRGAYIRLYPNSVLVLSQRRCIRLGYASRWDGLSESIGISQADCPDFQSPVPGLFCLDMVGLPRLITEPRSLCF